MWIPLLISVGVTHSTGVTCWMFYAVSRLAIHYRCPGVCTWARSWSSGPSFVNWLPQESIMKRPFFGAQFWKSNNYPPPPPGLIESPPPGVPAVRTMPCSEVGCQRCREGRGGFRFPFVRTYARSSVVVAAGVSPAQAWEDFHRHEVPRLAAVDVLNRASGLWPTDLLPDQTNKLLRHVESPESSAGSDPRGCRYGAIPPYEAIPSWAEGRLSESARAHRALWLLLGALVSGMEVLLAPCLSCGCPSVLQCRRCASAVCRARKRRRWWTVWQPRPSGRSGSITGSWWTTTSPTPSLRGRKQQPTLATRWRMLGRDLHDLEDDVVMGLVDRAVAAGMGTEAAARPVVRLSKMARKSSEVAAARKKGAHGPDDKRCCR